MKRIRPTTHPVRTFGLWALGSAVAYLIIRELTTVTSRGAATGAGPTTPSTLMPSCKRDIDRDNGNPEDQLDAAIDATFPASDPIAMQFE
jgi:hypothetical protein